MQQAKRNAVLAALIKWLARNRNNPKVWNNWKSWSSIGEQWFGRPDADMVGDTYRINITLVHGRQATAQRDQRFGPGPNTNKQPASPFVLMDEFFTTPTDLRARTPLEELIECQAMKPVTV